MFDIKIIQRHEHKALTKNVGKQTAFVADALIDKDGLTFRFLCADVTIAGVVFAFHSGFFAQMLALQWLEASLLVHQSDSCDESEVPDRGLQDFRASMSSFPGLCFSLENPLVTVHPTHWAHLDLRRRRISKTCLRFLMQRLNSDITGIGFVPAP